MPIVAISTTYYSIMAQSQYTTPARKLQEIYEIFGKNPPLPPTPSQEGAYKEGSRGEGNAFVCPQEPLSPRGEVPMLSQP